VVIESGVNLLDGWQPGNKYWCRPVRLRENRQFFAEHLLNFSLQMGYSGATEEPVTLTKQMKIGLREQVRVNWKTVSSVCETGRHYFRFIKDLAARGRCCGHPPASDLYSRTAERALLEWLSA
jgi:hypothetical protein